jgi:hypothetical protein
MLERKIKKDFPKEYFEVSEKKEKQKQMPLKLRKTGQKWLVKSSSLNTIMTLPKREDPKGQNNETVNFPWF